MSKRRKRKQNKSSSKKHNGQKKLFDIKPNSTKEDVERIFSRMCTQYMMLGARTFALYYLQMLEEWDARYPIKTIESYQEFQNKITTFCQKACSDRAMNEIIEVGKSNITDESGDSDGDA